MNIFTSDGVPAPNHSVLDDSGEGGLPEGILEKIKEFNPPKGWINSSIQSNNPMPPDFIQGVDTFEIDAELGNVE